MRNIGIGVSVQEDLTQKAPRMGEAMRGLAEQAEKLRQAFDFEEVNKQFNEFSERQKRIYDQQQANQRTASGIAPNSSFPNTTTGDRSDKNDRWPKIDYMAPSRGVRSAGSILNNLGRTGDVGQAAGSAMDAVPGLLTKLGGPGLALAGGVGLAAGTTMVANELSKQYEAVMQESMDLAASLGMLGKSAEENSLSISDAMSKASKAASEFGYTLQEGTAVMKTFSGQGVSGTGDTFAYSRFYGADPMALAYGQARGRRFGAGNLLGYTAGGLSMSGMGSGQFTEYMEGMLGILEEGLSKGIVRGFEDISGMMNFLSGAGVQYRGAGGANLASSLNQAMSGATGLGRDTDVLLYQAARAGLGGKGGMIDIMRAMENGMDTNELKYLFESVQTMQGVGNREGIVPILKEALGLNWTQSSDLFDLMSKGDWTGAQGVVRAPGSSKSAERDLLGLQEDIKESIREVGANIIETKVEIVKAIESGVDWLGNKLGGDIENRRNNLTSERYFEANKGEYDRISEDIMGNITSMLSTGGVFNDRDKAIAASFGMKSMGETLRQSFTGPETMASAIELSKRLESMDPYQKSQFTQGGLNRMMSMGSSQDMLNYLNNYLGNLKPKTAAELYGPSRGVAHATFGNLATSVGADPKEGHAFAQIMDLLNSGVSGATIKGINEQELTKAFTAELFSKALSEADIDKNNRISGDAETSALLREISDVLKAIRDQPVSLEVQRGL